MNPGNQLKNNNVNIGSITHYNPETGLYLVDIAELDAFKSLVVTDELKLFKPSDHDAVSVDDYPAFQSMIMN